MGKRVTIVFEETGDTPEGKGFDCFLEGVSPERRKLPDDELSPAEFWGMKMFAFVVHDLNQVGVVKSVKQKGTGHGN